MDDELDVQPIEQRWQLASPGPWRTGHPKWGACPQEHDHYFGRCRYAITGWHHNDQEVWRADSTSDFDGLVAGMWDYEDGGIRRVEDAIAIAHAPDDIAALLYEVRRLRRKLSELEAGPSVKERESR